MRSYRSTLPITNFATSILPNGDDIEAFNRPGSIPELILAGGFADGIKQLRKVVARPTKDNYATVVPF